MTQDKEADKNDDNFDRLWKTREVLDILNVYSKFYNPSEHLAIYEVTVLIKGKDAFKQCIPKKHRYLEIKYRIRKNQLDATGLDVYSH